MRRKIWIPVLVTVLTLAVAGLPRNTWKTVAAGATSLRSAAVPRIASWIDRLQSDAPRWIESVRAASPGALPVAVGAGSTLLAACTLWLAHRASRPKPRRVLDLARRGHHPADIARRTGLAQDAVRAMLRPRSR